MTQTNDGDTIIDEIHRTRQQIADKFDGDISAILDDARKRQAASGRPVWQDKTTSTAMPPSDDASVSDAGETPVGRE